jgi:hypothetical protein
MQGVCQLVQPRDLVLTAHLMAAFEDALRIFLAAGVVYGALEGVYAWCSVQSVLGACYCYPTHWVVVLLQCCLLLLKLAAFFLLGTVLVGSPTCRHQISISAACERVCTQTVVGMVSKQAAAGLACTHAQGVQQDGRECLGLDIWT